MEIKQPLPKSMASATKLGGADTQISFLSQKILPSVSSLRLLTSTVLIIALGPPPLLSPNQDPVPANIRARKPKYSFRPPRGNVPPVHDPDLER